jgi:hypothetical protein
LHHVTWIQEAFVWQIFITKEINNALVYVQVRDGPGPVSEVIERFCVNSSPRIITSSSNQMWVAFSSENATVSTFSAVISGIACKYPIPMPGAGVFNV